MVFQPMCGTFSAGSEGATARTSPGMRSRPGLTPCSTPRVARSCMPTHMPRKGRPRRSTTSAIASTMPGTESRLRRQSAKAPSPGRTMRSACATSSGSDVIITTDLRLPAAAIMRSKAFCGGAEVAGAIVDEGDGHRPFPGDGKARLSPARARGGRRRWRGAWLRTHGCTRRASGAPGPAPGPRRAPGRRRGEERRLEPAALGVGEEPPSTTPTRAQPVRSSVQRRRPFASSANQTAKRTITAVEAVRRHRPASAAEDDDGDHVEEEHQPQPAPDQPDQRDEQRRPARSRP